MSSCSLSIYIQNQIEAVVLAFEINESIGWDERKPNNDLPNQEKKQYWTVFEGKQKLYIHKGRIKKWSDLVEKSKQKLASMPLINRWEWKPIMAACLRTELLLDVKWNKWWQPVWNDFNVSKR